MSSPFSLLSAIKDAYDKWEEGNKKDPKDREMGRIGTNARQAPLGSGAANKAKRQVAGRARQIDDAVEAAQR